MQSAGSVFAEIRRERAGGRERERMELAYTVPGQPVSKGRPRFGGGHAYTPAKTRAAERAAKLLCASARPANWPTGARYEVTVRGFYGDLRRRDIDNLAKLHLDACNGIAWADDCQVDRLIVERRHDKLRPRTEVVICPCHVA